jgi:hypothetical protein
VNSIPKWRLAAGIAILAGLFYFLAVFTPIYLHDMKLRSYVADLAKAADSPAKPDAVLQTSIVEKAHALDLPVAPDNVHVTRTEGLHIDVRYAVRVNLPGYTVDLHFYPGAGSR